MDTIRTLIHNIRIADFLDIAIIAVVLYFILTWVRRRASRSVVIGIALVILLYSLARMLNMYLTSQLFHAGLTAVLMALVLVFHEDIRMAIERISSWNTLHLRHLGIMSSQTIDTLVGSVSRLAKDKIGALIVIKGRDSLERHLNGGTTLNGTLSISLLYSLFHPQTPSHDGAAVIEGERIDSFGVRLPLSRNIHEVGDAGTRHTAALGLAERSDSFIIVVSEERGTISVAEQGKLIQVPSDVLHQRLLQFYENTFPSKNHKNRPSWFKRNPDMKIASLGIAVVLWLLFAYRVETINRTFTIPIEYRNTPSSWVITDPKPTEVQVSLTGPERSFTFDPSTMVVSVDLSKLQEGQQTIYLDEDNINTPSGVSISQISPHTLSLGAYRNTQKKLPVKAPTTGTLPDSLQLEKIEAAPSNVLVRLGMENEKINEIHTEPINLSKITQTTTVHQKLILPPHVRFVDNGLINSKVTIKVLVKKRESKK